MLTLNITFASRAHFFHHVIKRAAGLSVAFLGGTAHRQVIHKVFVFFDRENDSSPAPLSVGDELDVLLHL
jgi:hypothetical protein